MMVEGLYLNVCVRLSKGVHQRAGAKIRVKIAQDYRQLKPTDIDLQGKYASAILRSQKLGHTTAASDGMPIIVGSE